MILEHRKTWFHERQPILDKRVQVRLAELADRLGSSEWLDGEFSAGDLLMVTVLRRLDGQLMEDCPNLADYIARGEARPAFKRAFDDQLAVFTARESATQLS